MGTVVINGSTSGSCTLTPAAVAGTATITLPTVTGTDGTHTASIGGNCQFIPTEGKILFRLNSLLKNKLLAGLTKPPTIRQITTPVLFTSTTSPTIQFSLDCNV